MQQLNLNSFRSAVNAAKSENAYLRISHNGQEVKTYGDSLLGREFGLHFHHRSSTNKLAREELFNAVRDSGLYQQEMLDDISKQLGIVGGKSTIGKKLELREVKAILNKAADNTVLSGKSFAIPLQNSTFMRSMRDEASKGWLQEASRLEHKNEIPSIFHQGLLDYGRAGFGLSLNGQSVVKSSDFLNPAECHDVEHKLEDFFHADALNGLKAARIINSFAQQGICADIMNTLRSSDARPIGNIMVMNMDSLVNSKFDISFQDDGSYKIACECNLAPTNLMQMDSNGQMKEISLTADSNMTFNFNIIVSFDNEVPVISVEDDAVVSGRLTQLPDDSKDLRQSYLNRLSVYHNIGIEHSLMNEMRGKEYKALSPQDQTNFVTDRTILSDQHLAILDLIGLDENVCKLLAFQSRTEGFKFDVEFFNRLFSQDQATCEHAIQELQQELDAHCEANEISRIPLTNVHSVVETMRAVEASGLKGDTNWRSPFSDYHLAVKTLNELKTTSPQQYQGICSGLRSDNPATRQQTLAFLKPSIVAQRKENEPAFLLEHFQFSINRYGLEQKMPPAQLNAMLEHVFNLDPQAESVINELKSIQQAPLEPAVNP